jgi:hypothetical protein
MDGGGREASAVFLLRGFRLCFQKEKLKESFPVDDKNGYV